jgi:hypothetical protein
MKVSEINAAMQRLESTLGKKRDELEMLAVLPRGKARLSGGDIQSKVVWEYSNGQQVSCVDISKSEIIKEFLEERIDLLRKDVYSIQSFFNNVSDLLGKLTKDIKEE